MDSLHEIITRHFTRYSQSDRLISFVTRSSLANANDVYWLIVSPRTNDASQLFNRLHSFPPICTFYTFYYSFQVSFFLLLFSIRLCEWNEIEKQIKHNWNWIEKCYNDRAPVQRLSRNSDIDDCRYSRNEHTQMPQRTQTINENSKTKTPNKKSFIDRSGQTNTKRMNEYMDISHFIESLKQNLNIELNVCRYAIKIFFFL